MLYTNAEKKNRGITRSASSLCSFSVGIADKIDLQIGVDFFVRTRWKTGRRVVLCGGFAGVVRAKKCAKMAWLNSLKGGDAMELYDFLSLVFLVTICIVALKA